MHLKSNFCVGPGISWPQPTEKYLSLICIHKESNPPSVSTQDLVLQLLPQQTLNQPPCKVQNVNIFCKTEEKAQWLPHSVLACCRQVKPTFLIFLARTAASRGSANPGEPSTNTPAIVIALSPKGGKALGGSGSAKAALGSSSLVKHTACKQALPHRIPQAEDMKNWLASRKLVLLSCGSKSQQERKKETKYLTKDQRKENVLTHKGELPGTWFLRFSIFEECYSTLLGQVRHVTCPEVMQLLSYQRGDSSEA